MGDNQLIVEVTARAKEWLSDSYDEKTRKEVQALLDRADKTELIEAFYKDLEFGTGGLRGIMGAGTNRVNIYTIGAATQGYANYLLKEFADLKQIKVVLGHDCRNNSKFFARTAANIFTANGIKAYLFEDLRPTPEISYAIRSLGCQGGGIVTASHNPKVYNGYKVYWNDGAQVTPPHDANIIKEVDKVKASDIKFKANDSLLEILSGDMDKEYIKKVQTLLLSPDSRKKFPDLPMVYTPLHGAGIKIMPQAFKEAGFTNLKLVDEQAIVSGNFETVESPNPEDPVAMKLLLKRGEELKADLVFATDPDADRIGVGVRDDKDKLILLNGNQIMILLVYYILTRKKELGQLTGNEYTVRTIVTSELVQTISEKIGVEMLTSYTGFKWIALIIKELEGKKKYIGGGEESFGFLAQDFTRDKDSVSASLLFAEMLSWAKDNGKTIYELLQDVYIEYGFSKERGISIVREGRTGAQEIEAMMKKFRESPMKTIAGSKVVEIKDYLSLEEKNLVNGKTEKIVMPDKSNVLQYLTEDKTKVSIRPSGTEPKIKFYLEVHDQLKSRKDYDMIVEKSRKRIDEITKELGI